VTTKRHAGLYSCSYSQYCGRGERGDGRGRGSTHGGRADVVQIVKARELLVGAEPRLVEPRGLRRARPSENVSSATVQKWVCGSCSYPGIFWIDAGAAVYEMSRRAGMRNGAEEEVHYRSHASSSTGTPV